MVLVDACWLCVVSPSNGSIDEPLTSKRFKLSPPFTWMISGTNAKNEVSFFETFNKNRFCITSQDMIEKQRAITRVVGYDDI